MQNKAVANSLLVVGTGALATLFAARLSKAGINVIMLGSWLEGLTTLSEQGARLIDMKGLEHTYPVRVVDSPSACQGEHIALVLVKAWQTERAAEQLADCLTDDGLALSLQNGLGNYETLAQRLGPARVSLGVTTTGATLVAPGLVRVGGEGIVSLESHPKINPVEILLRRAGFDVQVAQDAHALLWGKLVVNAAINPLTALLRVPNGVLLERESARRLMAELAREAAEVAKAHGVGLPYADAARAAEEVALHTASNNSSMLQDVQRGAPTEIDAICGAIVRAGDEKGLKTPINRVMWLLIHSLLID